MAASVTHSRLRSWSPSNYKFFFLLFLFLERLLVAVEVKTPEYHFYLAYCLQSSDSDTDTQCCETDLDFQIPFSPTKQLLKSPLGLSMENSE